MSRRDYEAIASILAGYRRSEDKMMSSTAAAIAIELAAYLHQTYPTFDQARFFLAVEAK